MWIVNVDDQNDMVGKVKSESKSLGYFMKPFSLGNAEANVIYDYLTLFNMKIGNASLHTKSP